MNGLPLASLRASAVVVLASVTLAACGPDDAVPEDNAAPNASQANTPPSVSDTSILPPRPTVPSGAMAGNAGNTFNAQTSRTMGAAPHNTQTDASILDAQASLAADKQQVAPVHRYAPGDDSH